MRVVERALIIGAVLVVGGFAARAGWHGLKEQYLLPWAGEQLSRRIEARTGWRLNYRGISGSLVSDLRLIDVRLDPVRLAPHLPHLASDLSVRADRIDASYHPLDLLRGRVRQLAIRGGGVRIGNATIRLTATYADELTVVRCPTQQLSLADLSPVMSLLPERTTVHGRVRLGGQVVLNQGRPETVQFKLTGDDLRVRWGVSLDARTDVTLELSGPAASPALTGTIQLVNAIWSGVSAGGGPPGAAFEANQPKLLGLASRFPGSIRVALAGDTLWINTERVHARVRSNIILHKAPDSPALLSGTLQALAGTYHVRGRRFSIREAVLKLPAKPGDPLRLDARVETRIRRYRIFADVHGTLRDSHLQLSSKPDLSDEEILALLVFGQRFDRLDAAKRQQLAEGDAAAEALDLLFLGRAELLAARWLGLDEINVKVTPESAQGTALGGPQIESVEVGKYLIPNRLFGSYGIEPPRVRGGEPKHVVGAEVELSENWSVGATVKGGRQSQEQDLATTDTAEQDASRRLQADEAFIRFRWKF